ncbi:DinB family protein [Paenibacillus sp. J22TS3]|uniref:DinB family protein n=1 Tax=Paenibacillus sp. J22TS3 TaxID=2807192 RepID=UPI001B05DCC9|nr:DinB family protein [Paenibacillus sp. J22TS3]GIP22042.1 hypothetical protein J22TS3_23170 [Paenibacillus sp. J22TS3]
MNIKSISEIIHEMENWTAHYEENVNRFGLEQLQQVHTEGGWSLGQMYVHLIGSALYMQLRSAQRCLEGEEELSREAFKTEVGEAVFKLGGFPPIRVQVPPSPQYTPQQPTSREQLLDGFKEVLEQMKALEPKLENYDEQYKAPHPRLGALSAMEWFALTEMHYRHHLLQEERLLQALES